jgi:signal transduction histidine kinase
LVPAIHEQIMRFSWPDGLQVNLDAPENLPNLPAAVEVAAYRIILEGLTNVCRHAKAKNCRVTLQIKPNPLQQQMLQLEIWDDGIGLPEGYQSGVGLLSMQERTAELGGDFSIRPAQQQGTCVCAKLPIALPDEEAG